MNEAEAQLGVDRSAESFWVLTLNRPEHKNALRTSLLSEIAAVLETAGTDINVRAVVITGGDTVFAAGADINEMAQMSALDAACDVRPSLWARIRAFEKPLIAAVNGFCLGAGNELLLRCDLAVAGPGAQFGQPEINVGIMPGAGGAALLPRFVGEKRAARMAMLGDFLSAEEAFQAGLVSHLSDGDPVATAKALAQKLAKKPPLALKAIKDALRKSHDMTADEALSFERKHFSLLFSSSDKQEGVDAFLEKRKPIFSGR